MCEQMPSRWTSPNLCTKPLQIVMPVSEDAIRESMKEVIDPELFVNIIDLGLVYEITIEDSEPADQQPQGAHVSIDMTMTSPACPAAPQILSQSKDAVQKVEGVGEVDIKLVMEPPWSPDRMTEDARDQLGIF